MNYTRSTPLPGLEKEPEVIQGSEASRKQSYRSGQTSDLADLLAGSPFEVGTSETGPFIVDLESGEMMDGPRDRGAAFGLLLKLASEKENQASGCFEAPGGRNWFGAAALWKSSLRIDPNWLETMRRRSRATTREALRRMMDNLPEREKLARRYGWKQRQTLKLLTLTMPHLPGRGSVEEIRRINRAFSLLAKRSLWRRLVWGGVKGIEDALDADGPHVHIHALVLSRYVDRETFRADWGACLTEATREALEEDVEPITGFIDVRRVKRKGAKETSDECGIETALNEVTKYVTKPADFLEPDKDGRRIPRNVLLELCEVERWPRMFELMGWAREQVRRHSRTREKRLELAAAAKAALDSIHRAYLTGEPAEVPHHLRLELANLGAYDVEDDAEHHRRVVEGLLMLQKVPPKKVRPPSWRELLETMPPSMWLQTMWDRWKRGRKFRLRQLMERFPGARLVLGDGSVIDCPA